MNIQKKYNVKDRVIQYMVNSKGEKDKTKYRCYMVVGFANNYAYLENGKLTKGTLYKCKRVSINGEIMSGYKEIKYLLESEIDSKLRDCPKWAVPKNNLKKLYVTERKTLQEIGNIYGVSRERIRQLLEKYNIARRTVGKEKVLPVISKEKLEELYLEKNMTLKEIANKLNVSASYISQYKKIYNIPTKYSGKYKRSLENRIMMAEKMNGVTSKEEGAKIYKDYHENKIIAKKLAKKYDYSIGTIYNIVNCKHWTTKHLKE